MWTTQKAEWRLWSDGEGEYLPIRGQSLFVIGDEDLARQVVARMITAGVEIVVDH